MKQQEKITQKTFLDMSQETIQPLTTTFCVFSNNYDKNKIIEVQK